MKKFLVIAASLLIFGLQADAAPVDDLNMPIVEQREVGHWANFRDKVILNRKTDKERRKREEWERRHRQPPPPRQGYAPPPPPHHAPPPPPPGYGAPPPPPPRRY